MSMTYLTSKTWLVGLNTLINYSKKKKEKAVFSSFTFIYPSLFSLLSSTSVLLQHELGSEEQFVLKDSTKQLLGSKLPKHLCTAASSEANPVLFVECRQSPMMFRQ